MIIACPACRTRYRVAAEAVSAPRGRKVRCAACGHLWLYVPEPATTDPGPPRRPPWRPPPGPPLRAEPDAPAGHAAAPRRRPAAAWTALVVLLVLLSAVTAAGILGRDRIAARSPVAARIYALFGLDVPAPGAGLAIGDVAPVRSGDGLIVEGDITNTTPAMRTVPRLRVALRDAANREVAAKIIDPPTAQLPPGATAHFAASFDHAGPRATGVTVTFVTG